jgi:hypothetical protein
MRYDGVYVCAGWQSQEDALLLRQLRCNSCYCCCLVRQQHVCTCGICCGAKLLRLCMAAGILVPLLLLLLLLLLDCCSRAVSLHLAVQCMHLLHELHCSMRQLLLLLQQLLLLPRQWLP